ncbi:MAG: hypothetical protein Q8N09_08420 [Thermodesulfovibrionia bacterium]|nr:hypothetical protein [Thermodesulfovibrionia bacterium]
MITTFKNEEKTEKAEKAEIGFMGLTNIIYFLIFIPAVFFGVNLTPPAVYDVAKHIQYIIYFEGGLLVLIGALHFFLMAISSRIKL